MDIPSPWYAKLESRWATRRRDDWTGELSRDQLELRRVPTFAERVIAAHRASVWAAVKAGDEPVAGWTQKIVGAPTSGLGAKGFHVGPPLPPFGMRSVMYSEVTAVQDGHWLTSQTLAGTWEHTETLLLQDAPDGRTLARISGWWMKPAPRTADFSKLQVDLNDLAAKFLDRLAGRAEGSPTPAPTD